MATPAANGNPDSFFIAQVRRILRDQGVWWNEALPTDGVNGVVSATGKPFRLQRAPLWLGGSNPPAISAPSPINAGITTYKPVYDTAGVSPGAAASLTDFGAGGLLTAGTYQLAYTYVYPSGESGPSPLSNALAIPANHEIRVAPLGVVPAGVTSVKYYLIPTSVGASVGGLVGNLAVPSVQLLIAAAGDGTLPVLVVSDTGEIVFPVPPANGNLNISYQVVRTSDQEILDALTEGMRHLFPEIWQPALDTSLVPSTIQYEYTLPAVFNDPRVEVLNVEVRDPNILQQPFRSYDGWARIGLTTLSFFELGSFSPAGSIRISYNAPYQNLSDLESSAMHLPVYYAAGRLLADQESSRTRQDELVPLTGEGGSQAGAATSIGEYWMTLFERGKQRLARPLPLRLMKEPPSWESLWRAS